MGRLNTNGKEMDEFRKHLKEFREAKGFNKRQFSREIGMSENSVQRIEKNQKNPGYKFLKALNEKYPEVDLLEWFGFKVVR